MIRINLVAGERRAAKARAARAFKLGQKMTVAGSLILVLTALGIGWRYWALGQTAAQIERDIDAARREEQRLAEDAQTGRRVRGAAASMLQQRVALIDELRKGQNAPVHMIDQISRVAAGDDLADQLKQDGYDVTIEGRCMSLTSLSDFVGNLEASRYFKRPVEIMSSEVVAASSGGARPDSVHDQGHVPDGRHRQIAGRRRPGQRQEGRKGGNDG